MPNRCLLSHAILNCNATYLERTLLALLCSFQMSLGLLSTEYSTIFYLLLSLITPIHSSSLLSIPLIHVYLSFSFPIPSWYFLDKLRVLWLTPRCLLSSKHLYSKLTHPFNHLSCFIYEIVFPNRSLNLIK